jgi:DNA mismatch endonuclease, patch repair protein
MKLKTRSTQNLQKKTYIRDGRAPLPKNEITSKIMSAIRAKNTKPELILRKALWAKGLRGYRLHWKKAPGRPDISFPGHKFAIFVNGCYWHRCPYCNPSTPKTHKRFWNDKFKKNKERDRRKIRALRNEGWRSLTTWECQINKHISNYLIKINGEINRE